MDERLFWNEEERKSVLREIEQLSKKADETSSARRKKKILTNIDEMWKKNFDLFDEWLNIVSCQAEELDNDVEHRERR
ncbi:MAG: hypothetical protein PHI88_00285 [Candidatus Pacebacteria bacterium]|nr:hypothetical protein [Candidatus Paceibacterota bacterium]